MSSPRAAGPGSADAVVGIDLLPDETSHVEVLGDSGYATGQALATLAETGHTPLVKPWLVPPARRVHHHRLHHRHRRPDRDLPGRQDRPDQHRRRRELRVALRRLPARCAGCPLAARCTTSKRGRKLTVGEHFDLRHQHRQRADDPAWQADYRRHRPMVERSIGWLVRGGNRKLRCRGVTKNNAWLHHRTAALNLPRLLNLGLDLHDGAWTLA